MQYNFFRPELLVAMVILSSCGAKSDKPVAPVVPPVSVNLYKVSVGSATYSDEYPATINALNEVQIRAQVEGYVTGIYFKDGQHVTKGQKLYSIDHQQYQGSYEQAVANLNVAKANLDKAQKDADRYTELDKQDAIAKQILDHALADLQSAKMVVEAAKANVSSVQTNLRYSEISSPLTGTIGISQVKMGAAVSPGTTLMNTISSDDPVAVDIAVSEKEISRFSKLQKAGTKLADSIFTLQLPDGTIYPHPGEISLIDRAVDPYTGTIKTRLVFPNKQSELKVGMNCNLRVKNDHAVEKIMIPYRAVVEQMGEYFVYALGDSSKVYQKKLALGARIKDQVVVIDGIKAGDEIVIDGVQKVRDGAKVLTEKSKQN
ncbi:MAG: efflux RND transporter periplasmic adaptor subunit [Bacteroidetes bacterium]|nr:MAG: efflux RND transporter periplasmic adaptor subunit [Bacteroidota bacterium]